MRRFLILFIFLGFSAFAGAPIVGVGARIADALAYPYACKVTVLYQNSGDVHYCSGTIIDQTHLMTAAHCFDPHFHLSRDESVIVNCANQFLSAPTKVILPQSLENKIDASGNWEITPAQDQAILLYAKPLKMPVLTSAKNFHLYFDIDSKKLKPEVSCEILGYGQSEVSDFGVLHAETIGAHRDSKLQEVQTTLTSEGTIRISSLSGSPLDSSVDHGDSGGTLKCQLPGRDAELLGVTNSFSSDEEDATKRMAIYFSPVL